jgi:hypothetical protein
MNLISSPATINDGSTDHIYTLQQQLQKGSQVITTWKELAADSETRATVKSKYNASNSTILRSVGQVNLSLPIADGSLVPATVNISVVHHREHDVAALTLLGVQAKNMTLGTDFWSNIFNQM